MIKLNLIKSLVSASTILVVFLSMPVHAASQCKGLDNSACDSNLACGWVNGYTRKDGREVSAFCRTSTKGKSKTSQPS